VRRLAIVLAAVAVACATDSAGPSPVHTDTVYANPALTGYVLAYTATDGPHRSWFATLNPTVGDNDFDVYGETLRGVVAFTLPALPPGVTLRGATLTIAQCQVTGTPFDSLGSLVVDHLVPTMAPDSATYDTTALAAAVATIPNASSAQVSLLASVAADYAVGDTTTSMYRLRFSRRDGDNDQVSDNVVFCPPALTITSSP
jgi:hypothetical protein